MRKIDINKIEIVDVNGIDHSDYPDFCDAFISSAYWTDTDEDLTDEELDALNSSHGDLVYEEVIKRVF